MRLSPLAWFVLMFALLAQGCGGPGATYDGVRAPPAGSGTSRATEDLIAQRAAAKSKEAVDKANTKAAMADLAQRMAEARLARTAEDAAAAQAKVDDARAALKAAQDAQALDHGKYVAVKVALADQGAAEVAGSLRRFYVLAVLLGVLAALVAWEGNLKVASAIGVVAGALVVCAQAVIFAVNHEDAILAAALVAAVGAAAWHWRGRIAQLEKGVEHLLLGGAFADAVGGARRALAAVWGKMTGAARRAEDAAKKAAEKAEAEARKLKS